LLLEIRQGPLLWLVVAASLKPHSENLPTHCSY